MRTSTLLLLLVIFTITTSCSQEANTAKNGTPLPYQKIIYKPIDKPTAPIDVDIRFEKEPIAGQKTKITFSASSQVFAEDVELNISMPSDVSVHSNVHKWRGKMNKASPQNLDLECTFPDNKRREIIATATITYGRARLVSTATLIVGTEDDPSKTKPPAGTIKKNEKGEDIIEFTEK